MLDQLSLSAWMPATMLVGNVSLLTQLYSQRNLDLGAAIISLTGRPLGIIVVLLFSLVLAAIVTQAFQFEAIRLFEGYWGHGRARSFLAGLRIRNHIKKVRRLERVSQRVLIAAYISARNRMVQILPDLAPVNALQQILKSQISDEEKLASIRRTTDFRLLWDLHRPAERMRRADALEFKIRFYPKEHRILPTRLGNTIRSYEDRIRHLDGDLQGYVLRNYKEIQSSLQLLHDQFRTRLDMYCSLVVVFAFLSVLGPALLTTTSGIPYRGAGAFLLYGFLAAVSYSAAITSARGYGLALLKINQELLRARDRPTSSGDALGYM